MMWGAVFALSATGWFTVHGARSASPKMNAALTYLAVIIVAGTIVGANVLAVRSGAESLERDLVFLLTEDGLVRRRCGSPDVKIDFSEMKALYEGPHYLLVESAEPYRRIAVPEAVDGFAAIRTTLAKHCPIVMAPRRSLLGLASLLAFLVGWVLVLFSKDAEVVRIAGAVALLLLGWESFRLCKQLHTPKRLYVWIMMGVSWIMAAVIVYLRAAA